MLEDLAEGLHVGAQREGGRRPRCPRSPTGGLAGGAEVCRRSAGAVVAVTVPPRAVTCVRTGRRARAPANSTRPPGSSRVRRPRCGSRSAWMKATRRMVPSQASGTVGVMQPGSAGGRRRRRAPAGRAAAAIGGSSRLRPRRRARN